MLRFMCKKAGAPGGGPDAGGRAAALLAQPLAALALCLALAAPALADRNDPDWPCPQHRVPQLSATQIWDGPSIDGANDWDKDAATVRLAGLLASRRIPQAEAIDALKAFAAAQPEATRSAALTRVFAGLLSTVNQERSVVMNGIVRFEQRQRARAKELEREGARIAELKATAVSDDKAKAELASAQELFDWNVRVFQERQANTPIACEIPVLMETRIFELAREIRALIPG